MLWMQLTRIVEFLFLLYFGLRCLKRSFVYLHVF